MPLSTINDRLSLTADSRTGKIGGDLNHTLYSSKKRRRGRRGAGNIKKEILWGRFGRRKGVFARTHSNKSIGQEGEEVSKAKRALGGGSTKREIRLKIQRGLHSGKLEKKT